MSGTEPAVRRGTPVRAILLACVQALVVVSCAAGGPPRGEAEGAARFNGTWAGNGGAFKLWALDDGRLQVEFAGEHHYESAAGPMINVGEAEGWARVEGDLAVFRPDGREQDCAITMRLQADALAVGETGNCGFGLNVTAAGTYQRINRDRPDFGPRVPPASALPDVR